MSRDRATRQPSKSDKPPVPQWMMSFSDMMTNMLCFFILMVSLSSMQEAGFVDSGIGSYLAKIEAMGLPGLMPSHRTLIPASSPLAQYKPPRIDPLASENWVKHVEGMLDEEFDRLSSGESTAEDQNDPFTIPLGIKFSPRSDRLTLKDRVDLKELALSLRARPGTLEILGSCADGEATNARDRLDLSLKRAMAVARYLQRSGLPAERLVPVGLGDSGPWEGSGSSAGHEGHLLALRWHGEQ